MPAMSHHVLYPRILSVSDVDLRKGFLLLCRYVAPRPNLVQVVLQLVITVHTYKEEGNKLFHGEVE